MNEQKKKIFYCITKSNWGGAQRYVYDLATSLPTENYNITILMGVDRSLNQKLKTKGIETIILGNLSRNIHPWEDFWALIKLFKIFQKEKPDIIHLNSSKIGLLGAIAGRLARVPKIIFTGHGWAFNEDRSPIQKKVIYWLHLLTIALTHKTIAVSEQTKNQISKKNFFAKKMTVIRNSLSPISFLNKTEAREEISKKLPAGQGDSLALEGVSLPARIWLGTISELHKNKGLKYMIEAIHLLETAVDDSSDLPIFIIIGDGERKEKLQERINRYGLQDTVFMIGRIDEAEKYLKAFDIFTLTSITEALPYAILEAGQAGLPIIASNVGGIPEIIDDMQSGILVRPKEPEEIEKAINFLLKNPEKMAIFGQKIQRKVLTDFTKEAMVKKTEELYN